MGIDYSLCLIVARKKSGNLLAHLSELLTNDCQVRLHKLSWSPESELRRNTAIGTSEIDARGISGFERMGSDAPNSYCLSLHVQLEPAMKELLGDNGFNCFDQPGAFGCMWTSVYAGDEYILLEMTAATSRMSRVLQKSNVVQSAWKKLAEATDAIFAYVDLEDETALQLFPIYGDLFLPDCDTLSFVRDYRYSIDRMANYIVNSNRE